MTDVLSYQMMHEGELQRSANHAYLAGDITSAIGFIQALASLKGVKLPGRPVVTGNLIERYNALQRYYLKCLDVLGGETLQTIRAVRATYANPITVRPKPKQEQQQQQQHQ